MERKDEKFRSKWVENLITVINSSILSIELLEEEIEDTPKKYKFIKLANKRPITYIIRPFWEAYIDLRNFMLYKEDYLELVKFEEILGYYSTWYYTGKNPEAKVRIDLALSKIRRRWADNVFLGQYLGVNILESIDKMEKGELSKEQLRRMKQHFSFGSMVGLAFKDEKNKNVGEKIKKLYKINSTYTHSANISYFKFGSRVKAIDILEIHHELLSELEIKEMLIGYSEKLTKYRK